VSPLFSQSFGKERDPFYLSKQRSKESSVISRPKGSLLGVAFSGDRRVALVRVGCRTEMVMVGENFGSNEIVNIERSSVTVRGDDRKVEKWYVGF